MFYGALPYFNLKRLKTQKNTIFIGIDKRIIFVNKKLAKRVRKQLALAKGNDEVNNILINYEKLVRKEGTAL